jgi:hypothetical protein
MPGKLYPSRRVFRLRLTLRCSAREVFRDVSESAAGQRFRRPSDESWLKARPKVDPRGQARKRTGEYEDFMTGLSSANRTSGDLRSTSRSTQADRC